jgi:hypothetical protein
LAVAGDMVDQHFTAFREAVVSRPLDAGRAVLVARLSGQLQHPEMGTMLSRLARSPEPEVREAVAEVWRHRPEAADPLVLEAMVMDPVVIVRRTAAGAAAAGQRFDLLDRMTQDPEPEVRREVAIQLGRVAPVGQVGVVVLEHLEADPEMTVRAAAYVAHLLQGVPVPHPPDLDPRVAAEAVREGTDIGLLRNIARTAAAEDRRLSAALALALIQDDVARDVARTDPVPSVRHRVAGALELSLPGMPEEPA